jgi:hypothetical protein
MEPNNPSYRLENKSITKEVGASIPKGKKERKK